MEELTRLDLDPFAIENLCYPSAVQQTLRDAGPVFWLSRHQTYGVARHAETLEVLQDPVRFISSAGIGLAHLRRPGAWREPSPIAEADPPAHTVVRKAMNRIVSPSVVRGWRNAFARNATELCDRVLAGGSLDAVEDIAVTYVHSVFPAALGVESHRENLLIVGHHSANAAGPQNELFFASQAALAGIADWYQHQQTRDAMIPGGFGERVFDAEAAGEIPPGIASPMLRTLLRGGLDTTISGIASTLWYLATNPEQWCALKEDPLRVGNAFEEALRLESPTSSIFRTTTAGAAIGGLELEPDTKLQVFVGAANRDPRKWERADEFDLKRPLIGHIGFGAGVHHCFGQRIAKLEAECLLGALVERVARVELAGEPEFRAVNMLRTLKRLPLKLTLH
jgi:cytochrome P450